MMARWRPGWPHGPYDLKPDGLLSAHVDVNGQVVARPF